ncbi:hypothetical protein BKP37_06315 [Anaerobacillus alkalilacustris]|uniref:Core-binding (CB) domain-containing protein n=1 Tax=Anaerobacillus alkalilacustris TaxID=393763 RepID=A0A1S2LW25_9BACI|nr:SEC-C metal-binding domain-containing protein [Anaerobacillus alkalilacustris]OIJ16373.1 hypothetical protein BKP37_06315 [Anaerobacillus alkalilacustris]
MSVNRNEPCSCGSGKKYKKCCMQKQNVIQMSAVKEERFMQQKHELVQKLEAFVDKKISYQEQLRLESYFNQRVNYKIDPKIKYPYFRFWLYFFHVFENGLRTIEWFNKEEKLADTSMVQTWLQLQPKFVQAVEWKDDIVIFEDLLTKERYPVANTYENISTPLPWYGTLGLLELFDNKYYFNGVRVMVDPQSLHSAATKIKELCRQENLSASEVMTYYFPELVGELLTEPTITGDHQEKEIIEYSVHYQIECDEQEVMAYLSKQFEANPTEHNEQQYSWVGEWHVYEDSELTRPIHIGNVYGMMLLKQRTLIFTSLLRDKATEFQSLVEANIPVKLLKMEQKKINIPFQAEFKNSVIAMDKQIPSYFSIYAQNSAILNIDEPIPMFDDLSLHSLMKTGRADQADLWLKQSEYKLFKNVYEQFGEVEVTADFNTVRKKLHLPISLFVTGGTNRATSIKKEVRNFVDEEDIPFLEQLGFTPSTVNSFYANDLLEFFKEKTIGKSETTVRKYQGSLYELRYLLVQTPLTSWEECTSVFWEHLLSVDYIQLFENMNKTQLKDLFSTLKALAKWLNKRYKTDVGKNVISVIQKNESDFIEAIEALNSVILYRYKENYSNINLPKLIAKHKRLDGLFEVVKCNTDSIEVKKIDSHQKRYIVTLFDHEVKEMKQGLIFAAEMAVDEIDRYHITELHHVYPPLAKRFLLEIMVTIR